MGVTIRAARAADAAAIRAMVRSEPLNPFGLAWPNFVVADRGGRVVGTVQLRPIARGVAELASLAVVPFERGQGVAPRLIAAALARAPERVLVVTAAANVPHYGRLGFRRIPATSAPAQVLLHKAIGQAAMLLSTLRGAVPRRLVILERLAVAAISAAA